MDSLSRAPEVSRRACLAGRRVDLSPPFLIHANGWRRNSVVNLKGLIHRELGEGLTEQEMASSVGVSERTIANILADKLPQDPSIWEKFARYFRIHVDFLRSGGPNTQRGCSTSQRAPITPPSAR